MPFVEVNGTALHVHVTGKGDPIVFVHPPFLSSESFNYQKAQLSDAFQVITFDIRGHGESQHSEPKLTYPLIVEDIKQLLDKLGIEKAFICGYSAGGCIALEALLTHPDRFKGGIIVSALSGVKRKFDKGILWLTTQIARRALRKPIVAITAWGNADMDVTYRNLYKSSIKGNIENQHQYLGYNFSFNCTRRLKEIKVPVLLIFGQKDRSFHAYARQMHSMLPNSSLYFLKEANHQIPIRAAARMNDLIRLWIESLQHTTKDRRELDYGIAQQMNPEMYREEEGLSYR